MKITENTLTLFINDLLKNKKITENTVLKAFLKLKKSKKKISEFKKGDKNPPLNFDFYYNENQIYEISELLGAKRSQFINNKNSFGEFIKLVKNENTRHETMLKLVNYNKTDPYIYTDSSSGKKFIYPHIVDIMNAVNEKIKKLNKSNNKEYNLIFFYYPIPNIHNLFKNIIIKMNSAQWISKNQCCWIYEYFRFSVYFVFEALSINYSNSKRIYLICNNHSSECKYTLHEIPNNISNDKNYKDKYSKMELDVLSLLLKPNLDVEIVANISKKIKNSK